MERIATRVAIIHRVARQLHEFLSGLSPDQLRRPSACDLWEVGDVVSHLTGGAERQTENMIRGLQGDSTPPSDFASGDAAALSAGNADRDIVRRRQLGDGLLAAFSDRYDKLNRLLGDFRPDQWGTLCWHARRGAMPAADYVGLRIQEMVVHDWDIRSALDPGAHLDSEGGAALLDFVPTWLGMTFRPGPRLDSPVVYRFEISGAEPSIPRIHQVTVGGDGFEVSATGGANADVAVRCDPEAYLLLVYGRRSAAENVEAGRMDVAGGSASMTRFENWFRGL